MNKRAHLPLAAFLCLASVTLLAGCNATFRPTELQPEGPSPEPPAGPPPTAAQGGSVTISPQYLALAPGQTFQFTATVTGGGQTQWSVDGVQGGSAAAGTVSGSGSYTAPMSIAQSENVTVTVALAGSAQQNYATAVVAIIAPAEVDVPLRLGESAGGPVLALSARAGKDGRAVWDDNQLRAEHLAGAHAVSEWRRRANLCGRDAGPDALSHARPGDAEQRRHLQRRRSYLHDGHAAGDFARDHHHHRRSHAAARHRDVEHDSARKRQPGFRHRPERQCDLDLQLSAQFKRLHSGHSVAAQRQSADGDLVPLLHHHGPEPQPDQRGAGNRSRRQHGEQPEHGHAEPEARGRKLPRCGRQSLSAREFSPRGAAAAERAPGPAGYL